MRLLLLIVSTLIAAAAHAAIVPSVFGGRVACAVRSGVQFCEGGLATRIESFDGVPVVERPGGRMVRAPVRPVLPRSAAEPLD